MDYMVMSYEDVTDKFFLNSVKYFISIWFH